MERFWPSNDTEMTDPPSDVWMGRQDWPLRAWTKAVAERRDVVVIVVIAMVAWGIVGSSRCWSRSAVRAEESRVYCFMLLLVGISSSSSTIIWKEMDQ